MTTLSYTDLARLRDDAIRRVCHTQWLRPANWPHGATNAELHQALCESLGQGVLVANGEAMAVSSYRGSKPGIVLNTDWWWEKVPAREEHGPVLELTGDVLVREVRRVMGIPYPAGDGTAVVQPALWSEL